MSFAMIKKFKKTCEAHQLIAMAPLPVCLSEQADLKTRLEENLFCCKKIIILSKAGQGKYQAISA
jgi:hypothetical protein